METTAIIMMILILGTIWGGLVFAINLAFRKEKTKLSIHDDDSE